MKLLALCSMPALLLALTTHAFTQTAPVRTFRGQLGNQPVAVKLQRDGDKLSGSYIYERVGQSITLAGQIDSQGNVTLAEFDPARHQTGKFAGKLTTDDYNGETTLAGTWARPDGTHQQDFTLFEQHIAFADPALQFTPKTISERRLHIGATYPQLVGTSAPGALAFNRSAAGLVTKLVAEFRKENPPADQAIFDADYVVLLARDDLVSVELNQFIDFGGAHPSEGYDTLNYDLRTGRPVALAALFKPGAKYEDALRRASTANWAAQQRALARENGTPPDDEPIVMDDNAEHWHAWGMTPRGLVLYYDLPHVIAVFDKVFIPWSELRDVLDPRGPAARITQASQK